MLFSKKPNYSLESIIRKIQTQLKSDFALGSGNKKEDLIRTANWSGSAIEYARMIATYFFSKNRYQITFTLLKSQSTEKDPISNFAIHGSRGLAARGGNCQESIGLAVYYLIKNNEYPKLKIDFLEMDDCFDHVLLKISTQQESFYYDPWMGVYYAQPSQELRSAAEKTIENLKYELASTSDKAAKVEIQTMLTQCMKKITNNKLKLHHIGSLSVKDFKSYCDLFEKTFASEMKVLYPGNPHL